MTNSEERAPPLVAHVIYRLDTGGLENGIVNLVNTMAPKRFRHAVIALAGVTDFRRRIRRPEVLVESLDKQPGKDPAFYLRFLSLLRRLRPAIVHTRNLGTIDLQWVAWLARVPVRIHGEHGWDASDLRGTAPRNLRIRRACRPVIDQYVTMSRDLQRYVEHTVGVAPHRIAQLYNGVDVMRFTPEGPKPADDPWRGIAGAFVVGTVGRLERTKNQSMLLRAFAQAARASASVGRSLRLSIIGDGPDRNALILEAQRLGLADQVWFAGSRGDVPELMRSFDMFVLPSLNEGVSNTILEAMATGRTVAAGRVGGNPELVTDGVDGCLFEIGRDEQLAAVLARYAGDPMLARAHGAAARRRIEADFTLQGMVDRYAALYDRLLGALH